MIEIDRLTHRFEEHTALEDVTLQIRPGEFVLLVGANGSGKTTLLDHLSGLHEADGGSIRIDGTDISDTPVAARTAIGRVFEDPRDQLVGSTVGEDVAFGPENLGCPHTEIDDRVTDSLAAVGMDGQEMRPIDALSGGERARVAIAGALAMDPDYLALDEPTAGLDHPGRTAIIEHLERLHREGMGIVLATHDLREVLALADRVVALDDGRIAADAPPLDVIEQLSDLGVRVSPTWRAR